ncbi:rhophilin-2-B-like isoform X1 [Limulus polyphemus]|uniref:Rhophilin-2-B-like isoform X1 n=1 Tax=Limulus polyphemus TaxID=6850 RepID=A0ABM1B528_LIMPO|nr:rhophilin-2-B-like isoform X1 [Limulus polyphemus]
MSDKNKVGKLHVGDDGYISPDVGNQNYRKIWGSDPRAATCRGKLQHRRAKLNQEINKQMMMRNGAEKLFKATTNKKMRETVALELSFVNSNLQLLKEQLAEMNSSVQIYQNESASQLVPMIPLGLKETKDIDFQEVFKDFILEHYSEDGNKFESSLQELADIRQACKTPARDQSGVLLLFQYYNLLYYVERRFFPPHRSMGIYFEWFDSLTGVPSTQKTVAFEKASILFNIAAVYTQIGAKQDRTKSSAVDDAVDNFLRAAGMFHYIKENFSNAPSMDLAPDTLQTLTHLMLAQARECLFEKLILTNIDKQGIEGCLDVAQEAAEVAAVYSQVHKLISAPEVKDYVPYSWISLILVKSEHYRALAHHFVAVGLLDHNGELNESVKQMLEMIHLEDKNKTCIGINIPQNTVERQQLGKAHLREALLLHEEALRLHRMCRQLRQVDNLKIRLRIDHDTSLNRYADTEEEDDFQEVLDPPKVHPSTKYQLTLTPPDFSQCKVQDLFHDLGPIGIFSARHHWTAPRTIHLERENEESFGFSVRGDCPVIIAGTEAGSLSKMAGLKEGDFLVAIGETDTKWCSHDEVVSLIQAAGNNLILKVVTPMDHNYLHPKNSPSVSPTSTTSSSSGVSSASSQYQSSLGSEFSGKGKDNHKRLTWNIFRRGRSKERERQSSAYDPNILLC